MIKYRWLIPLLAYLLTILIGSGMHAARRAVISDMLEKSERDDLPLVLTFGKNRLVSPWRLHSLDDRTTGLYSTNQQALFSFGFMPGEKAIYYWQNSTLWSCSLYRLNLPDDRPRLLPPIDSGSLFHGETGEGFWWVCAPWMLFIEDNALTMVNHATGEKITSIMENEPPWSNQQSQPIGICSFEFSPMSGIIFMQELDFSPAASLRSTACRIWRYEIDSDEWTEIHQGSYFIPMSASPDGKIVAVVTYQSNHAGTDVVFIDGFTGAVVKTVQDAGGPFMGNRWAACVDFSRMTPGVGGRAATGNYYIKIFDMENNWEEREFVISDRARATVPLIIPFHLGLIEPVE